MRRSLAPLAAIGFVFAFAGACGDDGPGGSGLEVGQCVEELPFLSFDGSGIDEVPCDDDHGFEVLHVFDLEGDSDDYDSSDIDDQVEDECQGGVFEDYVGADYDETLIAVSALTPTESTWEDGGREAVCFLTIGDDVDESFEGAGDDFPLIAEGDDVIDDDFGGDDEDTSLEDFEDLIDECEGGDNAACDELYFNTPGGSEAEEIGSTCGGRSDEEQFGSCVDELGE